MKLTKLISKLQEIKNSREDNPMVVMDGTMGFKSFDTETDKRFVNIITTLN